MTQDETPNEAVFEDLLKPESILRVEKRKKLPRCERCDHIHQTASKEYPREPTICCFVEGCNCVKR